MSTFEHLANDPDFVLVLADPEVRPLIQLHEVDENHLGKAPLALSVQFRNDKAKDRKGPGYRIPDASLRQYRRSVGLMVMNCRSEILVVRQGDLPHQVWQLPQARVGPRENLKQAAYRKLREKFGIRNVEILAESVNWLSYEVSDEVARKVWGGRWKGQRQKWLLILLKGGEREIAAATAHPNSAAWRWATLCELRSSALALTGKLSFSLLDEFTPTIRRQHK